MLYNNRNLRTEYCV